MHSGLEARTLTQYTVNFENVDIDFAHYRPERKLTVYITTISILTLYQYSPNRHSAKADMRTKRCTEV